MRVSHWGRIERDSVAMVVWEVVGYIQVGVLRGVEVNVKCSSDVHPTLELPQICSSRIWGSGRYR